MEDSKQSDRTWPASKDDEGTAPAKTLGTDLRSCGTNPDDIPFLASILSVVKSEEEEGKKKKKLPALTDTLGIWLSPKGEGLFTLKGGGGNVELLQENQKSEKAVDGLIRSLVASEGLSHASLFMSSHVKIHHLKGKQKTVLRSPFSTLPR